MTWQTLSQHLSLSVPFTTLLLCSLWDLVDNRQSGKDLQGRLGVSVVCGWWCCELLVLFVCLCLIYFL